MTKELFDRLADVPKELLRFADALDAHFDLFWGISNAVNELAAIIDTLKDEGGVDKEDLERLINITQTLSYCIIPRNFVIYSTKNSAKNLTALINDIKAKEEFK